MRYIFWIIFVVVGISGCQTHGPMDKNHTSRQGTKQHQAQEKDSAPAGPIPTFFRRVIPHAEPLSRYGNPDIYKVNGQTYKVMPNANGYHSSGLASWYGTKFHSRRTSSGEHYDMYALTAAHRTLPLPTYLRVKNLDNGKVAIVKVNDRGPFHSHRILDLSYGAAVKLGIFPKGTAHVEIETVTTTPVGKAGVSARYYLQVGAFQSKNYAEALRVKLAKISRTRVFVERYKNKFIVKIGPFDNNQASARFRNQLARQGVKGAFSVMM